MKPDPEAAEWKPGMFYFRRAIRSAATMEELQRIALTLCLELEKDHEWATDCGLEMPRWFAMPAEVVDKDLEVGA